MAKYEKGSIVKGVVTGIESYGIFVAFDEFYSGLIHISEISSKFVKDPKDMVELGSEIEVQIIGIDEQNNHLNLSLKNLEVNNTSSRKRKRIIETPGGFKTLALNLEKWIADELEIAKK